MVLHMSFMFLQISCFIPIFFHTCPIHFFLFLMRIYMCVYTKCIWFVAYIVVQLLDASCIFLYDIIYIYIYVPFHALIYIYIYLCFPYISYTFFDRTPIYYDTCSIHFYVFQYNCYISTDVCWISIVFYTIPIWFDMCPICFFVFPIQLLDMYKKHLDTSTDA